MSQGKKVSQRRDNVASTEGGVVTDLKVRAQDATNLQEIKEKVGRLKNNKSTGAEQLLSE